MKNEVVIGIDDTECYMRLNAAAYNINRLSTYYTKIKLIKNQQKNTTIMIMKLMQTLQGSRKMCLQKAFGSLVLYQHSNE